MSRVPPWVRLAAVMLLAPWGGNQFTPLLVHYRAAGLPDVTVDLLLGVYVAGIVPGLLLGGPLSDRYGRRALLLPVAPLSAAGSLLVMTGPDGVAAMAAGRLLTGAALGLAMGVGTTWMVELCAAADPVMGRLTGARRAGVTLTLGLLVGAAVAAAWVQLVPTAIELVYAAHAALVVAAGALLVGVREASGRAVGRAARLRIPRFGRRLFLTGVLPVAPWVFACAAAAYAVLPARLADRVDGAAVGFSGLLTVLTLATGVAVQALTKRWVARSAGLGATGPMVAVVAGMAAAAAATASDSLVLALVAVLLLGGAYGLLLTAGLSGLARRVPPDHLAGATAVYHSLAYAGFFLPAAFSALAERGGTYPWLFGAASALAVTGLVLARAGEGGDARR